ncbi:stage III sporulation protein AD [Dehalobacterium formicoaceticum]|uniref:Stage III sporulation protein AD n=1 Tax=Dehalobacterium formicoaceticum TaxID=51515 RepID=A0ABT1Y518_9FIRM|nr:stage III sporulation protein AD [Dehalobacterium formicoaceticum]MCR6545962.1 stage III sporulation protein AD [Dehalobacterium formicoaceticum]
MEDLFAIIGLALVTTILVVFIKESKIPALGMVISVFVGAVIFIQILPKISYVVSAFEELATRASINTFYLTTIFKIIGISYIAEFGAQVCRDAGQGAIATKVEFSAKILVMVLAVPIIGAILESVVRLLP